MGYLSGWVDAVLKKDKDGRALYFPWGWSGKSYFVEREEDQIRIRNYWRLFNVLVLIILISPYFGLFAVVSIIIFTAILHYTVNKILVRRLTASNIPPQSPPTFDDRVRSQSMLELIIMTIGGGTLFALSVYVIYAKPSEWIGYAGAMLFGASSILSSVMLRFKLKQMKH